MKFKKYLDHINHYKPASGTKGSNRWTTYYFSNLLAAIRSAPPPRIAPALRTMFEGCCKTALRCQPRQIPVSAETGICRGAKLQILNLPTLDL